MDSIGQLGQDTNPTTVLTAIWETAKLGMFGIVSVLLTWGIYRNAVNSAVVQRLHRRGTDET